MRALLLFTIFFSRLVGAEIISFDEDRFCKPETDHCISALLLKTKSKTVRVDGLKGRFFLSKVNNQVFGCGGNTFSQGKSATLTNEFGESQKFKHLGPLIDCGISKDGYLYWFVYEREGNGEFAPKIAVINKDAQLIFNKKVTLGEKSVFVVTGIKITVNPSEHY